MANHSLSDVIATVAVSKNEYEELIRDSEKLAMVTNYVKGTRYIIENDIKLLLGIQEEKNEEMECETDGN